MTAREAVWLAAVAAFCAKLYCAATTIGTNDTDTFYNFGRFISEHGLLAQYRATAEFNHPPLTGWFCAAAYRLGPLFALALRLPAIVADLLAVGVLLRWPKNTLRPPNWALVLFALSPVNFMVSGFHGNVDSVLALLLLLALHAAVRERPTACGAWLGLACQVKVIPLLLAPALFFFWLSRRAARPFSGTATVMILTGWALPLATLPSIFSRHVLGYNSNWGSWGATFWLHATGWPPFAPLGALDLTPWQTGITAILKAIIVLGALALAWSRRALPASHLPTTFALTWALFFVAAPGVGAQYLVWLAPFFLLHSARWFATLTAASAIFLAVFYTTICREFPWNHGISTAEILPRWAPWSNLPWLTLAAFLVCFYRSRRAANYSSSPSFSAPSESSSGGRSWSL